MGIRIKKNAPEISPGRSFTLDKLQYQNALAQIYSRLSSMKLCGDPLCLKLEHRGVTRRIINIRRSSSTIISIICNMEDYYTIFNCLFHILYSKTYIFYRFHMDNSHFCLYAHFFGGTFLPNSLHFPYQVL